MNFDSEKKVNWDPSLSQSLSLIPVIFAFVCPVVFPTQAFPHQTKKMHQDLFVLAGKEIIN